MKLRPQPNLNEISATPTTSALNAHEVYRIIISVFCVMISCIQTTLVTLYETSSQLYRRRACACIYSI